MFYFASVSQHIIYKTSNKIYINTLGQNCSSTTNKFPLTELKTNATSLNKKVIDYAYFFVVGISFCLEAELEPTYNQMRQMVMTEAPSTPT